VTDREAGPTPDVVVVGAGVMGAWSALEAVRSGLRVTLLDAYGAGHARASSGDETRIIRSAHGRDPEYTRWSRRARARWLEAGEAWGEPLFVPAGVLWFAHREDGFEAASEATLRAEGIPVEHLAADEVVRRWPQVAATRLAWALHEPEAGALMARRGVAAVARAVAAEGGRFEIDSVRPGRAAGGRLADVVSADGRRIAAGAFVFAAGPWLPRLFPDLLGPLIRVTKQDVVYFGPPGGDRRFEADRLPAFVDYDTSYYGIPSIDGRGVKVAPDRYGPVFDPSAGDRLVDPETVRLGRRYLAERFPDLADRPVVETRVCQYETTPDTHFVLDRHPELENVWLVGGGSGHGFKHGPVIGETVAARLRGEPPEPWHDRFRVDRPRLTEIGMRTGGDTIAGTWDEY
jgi:glycine/D-amino acid oxidase-like deaminating enzyme